MAHKWGLKQRLSLPARPLMLNPYGRLPEAGEGHQSLPERDDLHVGLEAAIIANWPSRYVKPIRTRGYNALGTPPILRVRHAHAWSLVMPRATNSYGATCD